MFRLPTGFEHTSFVLQVQCSSTWAIEAKVVCGLALYVHIRLLIGGNVAISLLEIKDLNKFSGFERLEPRTFALPVRRSPN